jgi:hypothetical protein
MPLAATSFYNHQETWVSGSKRNRKRTPYLSFHPFSRLAAFFQPRRSGRGGFYLVCRP